MSDPVWFRSLYWRIAIGFVAMLALLLTLQAGLLLWLTGRFHASISSRTPQQLADLVARDLSDALTDNPELDAGQLRPGAVRRHRAAFRRGHARRPPRLQSSERTAAGIRRALRRAASAAARRAGRSRRRQPRRAAGVRRAGRARSARRTTRAVTGRLTPGPGQGERPSPDCSCAVAAAAAAAPSRTSRRSSSVACRSGRSRCRPDRRRWRSCCASSGRR